MIPPTPPFQELLQAQRGLSVRSSKVLIVLAMGCLSYGYAQFMSRLGLEAGFLFYFSLFVAAEAVYSHQQAKSLEGRERILFRAAEILTIIFAAKAYLLLRNGLAPAWFEFSQWQTDFMATFIKGDFVAALLLLIPVWSLTNTLASDVDVLHDREQDSSWDELGKTQNAIHLYRARLAGVLFGIGAFVVFFAVGARLNVRDYVPFLQGKFNPDVPIANVLIYFVLTLILLSQSQLALLRTRWQWEKTPVSPKLTRQWILSGAVFFGILAVIIFFLPTDYSLSFLDTTLYAFNLLVNILRFILALLIAPFVLCASLFKSNTPGATSQEPAPFPQIAPHGTTAALPLPFLQFLQSLLFWGILAVILVFALVTYIRSNQTLFRRLASIPFAHWLFRNILSIWTWLLRSGKATTDFAVAGLRRLRPLPGSAQKLERKIRNPGGLSPREQIIQIYLAFVETGCEKGLARLAGQTPYQYSQAVITSEPEIAADVLDLTEDFIEARYSQHPIPETTVVPLRSRWDRIRSWLVRQR